MVKLTWEQKVAIAKSIQLTIFGFTLSSVLSDSSWDQVQRDLKVAEIFSVAQSACKAAGALGFAACAYDKFHGHPCILTRAGFMHALTLVMRVQCGGLVLVSPCCSSWGYPNVSKTKRSKERPAGDCSYSKVRDGNFMARVALFFYVLAILRDADSVVEQSDGSYMWEHQPQQCMSHIL